MKKVCARVCVIFHGLWPTVLFFVLRTLTVLCDCISFLFPPRLTATHVAPPRVLSTSFSAIHYSWQQCFFSVGA